MTGTSIAVMSKHCFWAPPRDQILLACYLNFPLSFFCSPPEFLCQCPVACRLCLKLIKSLIKHPFLVQIFPSQIVCFQSWCVNFPVKFILNSFSLCEQFYYRCCLNNARCFLGWMREWGVVLLSIDGISELYEMLPGLSIPPFLNQ